MSKPKVILPWFLFWEIHVLTAVSPCSVCSHSSAPAPRSPQPILAVLDSSRQLSQQMAIEDAEGMQEE